VEVVASLSQGRTAAAQCGLFTHKSVPVIFEPLCSYKGLWTIKAQTCIKNSKVTEEVFTLLEIYEVTTTQYNTVLLSFMWLKSFCLSSSEWHKGTLSSLRHISSPFFEATIERYPWQNFILDKSSPGDSKRNIEKETKI